jgi:hypothetical protein
VKCSVVQRQYGRGGLTLCLAQLIENINHMHASVPTPDSRVILLFEGIINARIEGVEACLFDVAHRHEVVIGVSEASVDGCLFHLHQWQSVGKQIGQHSAYIHCSFAGVVWETESIGVWCKPMWGTK